jgi:hypothetical protein
MVAELSQLKSLQWWRNGGWTVAPEVPTAATVAVVSLVSLKPLCAHMLLNVDHVSVKSGYARDDVHKKSSSWWADYAATHFILVIIIIITIISIITDVQVQDKIQSSWRDVLEPLEAHEWTQLRKNKERGKNK